MKIQTMMKTTNKILQYYKTNSPRFRQIEYIKIVNILLCCLLILLIIYIIINKKYDLRKKFIILSIEYIEK